MIEKYGSFKIKLRILQRAAISTPESFDKMVDVSIMDCYEPQTPFITRETPVVTMGSCFAQNISASLSANGYKVMTVGVSDKFFTPSAIQTFGEAIRDQVSAEDLRGYWDLQQNEMGETRRLVREGATVIITFGLSAVWRDKHTRAQVFDPSKKAVSPEGHALRIFPDPNRYEMHQLTVGEITKSMFSTIAAFRVLCPTNKIILTLSPKPLVYSGSDEPVMVADCISKSSLRAALHEVRMAEIKDVYYFPSFEILRWLAPMAENIWYADKMLAHIRPEWIAYVLARFRKSYCADFDGAELSPPLGLN